MTTMAMATTLVLHLAAQLMALETAREWLIAAGAEQPVESSILTLTTPQQQQTGL